MYNNEIFKNLLIIGGNVAGLAAASQARRTNPGLNITVLEAGGYVSYGTCGLPYYLSGEISKFEDLFAYPVSFFEEERNIKILLNHKVVRIDPSQKEVLVNINNSSQNKAFSYDKLIICSGGSPISLPIPGISAPNVFGFRTVEDVLKLKSFISQTNPEKATIIGGGSIGFLVAEALVKLGIKATIVEKERQIFKDYEEEISTILHKKARLEGVEIFTGSSVNSINQDYGGKAISCTIKTADRGGIINTNIKTDITTDIVNADFIIIATGILANTGFLSGTSIDLGINRAIKVSPKLQTSYVNIYAAGDCCTVKNLVTGKDDYIPTANNAAKMGRIAGENAAGGDEIFPGSVGTKIDRVFGLEIAKTGITLNQANELGFNAFKISDSYPSHVKALPGAESITITIIVDSTSTKLLGAQMIGREGIAKRIDIFATALTREMTVGEIYMLDLSYAPSVSTVWDPVNKICGKAVLKLKRK